MTSERASGLLAARQHGSYLFLRYAMRGKDTPGGQQPQGPGSASGADLSRVEP